MYNCKRNARVLIVESNQSLLHDIYSVLKEDASIAIVGKLSYMREFPEARRRLLPDVSIVGPSESLNIIRRGLPGEASEVMRVRPITRFITMVDPDNVEVVGELIHAGARAVLMRNASAVVLRGALRDVLAGRSVLESAVVSCLVARIADADSMQVSTAYQRSMAVAPPEEFRGHPNLTSREVDVLRGLVEGLSNKSIAASLDVGVGTIAMYVKRIFLKLRVNNRISAALVGLGKLELAARIEREYMNRS